MATQEQDIWKFKACQKDLCWAFHFRSTISVQINHKQLCKPSILEEFSHFHTSPQSQVEQSNPRRAISRLWLSVCPPSRVGCPVSSGQCPVASVLCPMTRKPKPQVHYTSINLSIAFLCSSRKMHVYTKYFLCIYSA